MAFESDQILWYRNGVFGDLGYAVPNYGNDGTSLNQDILYLVDVIGRNLFAVMHHQDTDSRVPPSINTLTRIHKLITRARTILDGRDKGPAEPRMEAIHATPAPEAFLIYPVPYFRVRNRWMKQYAGLVLMALSEAMQHTENRQTFDVSTQFSGLVGQYLHRVYKLMATELFGVPIAEAQALDFTLSEEQLQNYDPAKWFTSTELIDTVPVLSNVPTEDDLVVLSEGIPARLVVGLERWPAGGWQQPEGDGGIAPDGTTATAENTSSFAAAPAP